MTVKEESPNIFIAPRLIYFFKDRANVKIEDQGEEIEYVPKELHDIAVVALIEIVKNSCCDSCREAGLVAAKALKELGE